MDSKAWCWTGIAYLACASAVVSADEFAYVEPLFKDLAPGAPGGEITITPLLNWVDTDADGYPDKLKMAFNVWTAGTNTKLLQTVKQTVTPPPLPCTLPLWVDDDLGIKFMGATSASRVHMVLSANVECEETGTGEIKFADKAIWYSADVASTGASYAMAWKDWEVLGTNGVDWDGDGTKELQLILDKENAAGDTAKGRVIYMSFSDGTIEADNIYDIEYRNF